jgi:hypothetical protein
VGERNNSLARVQPVFNALLDLSIDGEAWLDELWDLAVLTRPASALPRPAALGRLVGSETPLDPAARIGTVYERTVAPPAAFLRWLLDNPQRMRVRDQTTFGAKSVAAQQWRGKLFSGNAELAGAAQAEGVKQLSARLAQRGRSKWWAFEGFTRVDCCLVAADCVLFIEGTPADLFTPSTLWFEQRRRLWRNVEAARELAGTRGFAVILAVENEADGTSALADAAASRSDSYPHLDPAQQHELDRHLLGFVTWAELVTRFSLAPDCLSPAAVS